MDSFFVSRQLRMLGFTLTLFAFPLFSVLAEDVSDPFRGELWYLDQISVPDAWESQTGSQEIIVAVLDAGFDLDHEDLKNQYWVNQDETAGDVWDNDRNGYEDDVQGWDFVDSDPDPSSDISDPSQDTVISHGTVVAGIIAAQANNGLGVAGIAWGVQIMPLRILDENGAGTTSDVRRAVEYAVDNGADVINLSLVFTKSDSQLRDTLKWAHDQGVIIVAAIGNGGMDTDQTRVYPACFDQEIGREVIIGVAATDAKDKKAEFSNFGTACVDLAAPGTNVFGAVYKDSSSFLLSTSYGSPWEGTSIAAPMVSGAAALLRSTYPSLTSDQVRLVLKLSVDPVAETSLEARKRLGAGRLNVSRAMEMAAAYANGLSRSTGATSATHPSGTFVVAQGHGSSPLIRRYDGHGEFIAEFFAYHEAFTGGVRLAVGDITGDGVEEIVTGAGPGGGPQVRVFSLDGTVKSQFFAFDEGGRTGIRVALGDVNNDGVEEIIVTQDQGGTGQVRIFNRFGHLSGAFFPFDRTETGLSVSVGDLDGDKDQELVISELTGDGSVRVFDGNGRYVREVMNEQFQGGVTTAVGDLDQNGQTEILVAAGVGRAPSVWVYNSTGSLVASSFVFPIGFLGGVNLAVADSDQNGTTEIFATPASSGGPQVRIFNSLFDLIGGFFTFNPSDRFGTSIAIWNP